MDDAVEKPDESQGQPMSSRHKVVGMLADIDNIEPAGVDPGMQMLLGFATMARGHIIDQLPEDPAELDTLLANGAQLFLRLRSDDAPQLSLVGDALVADA